MKSFIKDYVLPFVAASIVTGVLVCLIIYAVSEIEEQLKSKSGEMRSMHKCGVLFVQEYGKDGWETVYQSDDPYLELECDNPDCDCHAAHATALEEDE